MLTVGGNHIVYSRGTSSPAPGTLDGLVIGTGCSITNAFDTPENSYMLALNYPCEIGVITE